MSVSFLEQSSLSSIRARISSANDNDSIDAFLKAVTKEYGIDGSRLAFAVDRGTGTIDFFRENSLADAMDIFSRVFCQEVLNCKPDDDLKKMALQKMSIGLLDTSREIFSLWANSRVLARPIIFSFADPIFQKLVYGMMADVDRQIQKISC